MDIDKYKKIFDKHGGVIKLSDFTSQGYHNTTLNKLMELGYVGKIKSGYYEWIDDLPVSEAAIINKLYSEGVVCLESALYIYGYSDRVPNTWHIAVSKNNSKSKYKIDYPFVKFYFLIDAYIELGRSTAEYEGHLISIFDRDRTICDVIRYENKMDKEIFNKAILAYVRDPKKRIGKLLDYAKTMNIAKKVDRIIGMWM
ncbi:MAG: type IV toxin-antitoxin system AbiEi family antitoxin domain-containing protein [Clostridiales bacterium]|nr:type IV toxin-antitoxin system AbiEi family antitoxin domain-containing protein [Clostridiales bacterium]